MTIKNTMRKICPCFGDNKAPSREIEMTSIRRQSSIQRQQPQVQQPQSDSSESQGSIRRIAAQNVAINPFAAARPK